MLSPDGDKDKDPLLINLLEESHEIVSNLQHLNLSPQSCYRDSEPINLYHKVGHGTLDMYVLSPAKDSKEVREFIQKWNNNDQKLFAYQKHGKDFVFPVQNLVSICALLVWQPANPNDTITRILYPGSTPQQKIFEGLEKIKHLNFVKHPVCTENSLTPSVSITALKSKSMMDKILQPSNKKITENKLKERASKDSELKANIETRNIENNLKNGNIRDIQNGQKGVIKSDSTDSEKGILKAPKQKDIISTNDKTEEKVKPRLNDLKSKDDQKKSEAKSAKSRSESQQRKSKPSDKKSPTTPKKTIDSKVNGEVSKTKTAGKPSPQTTPAKSTKEANNRKVVESKYKQAPRRHQQADKKESKPERKPVAKKPKDMPIAKAPGSPLKKVNGTKTDNTLVRKSKFDKEATTDSSTVSTPSADQDNLLKKDISKLTPEQLEQLKEQELADLKEEQEVVKEIEAVFRKGEIENEKDSDLRKIKDISTDDKEPEEYLIIEKEVIELDVKEDELQKHIRDSEESEKQQKIMADRTETPNHQEDKDMINKDEVKTEGEKTPPHAIQPKEIPDKLHSKEVSAESPEEKADTLSEKKMNDRDVEDYNKEIAPESQPEEKVSGTVESGATTTAPTLPEDERIPLDDIKEDNGDQGIEEKHVKEDTKEKDVPVIQLPPKPAEALSKLPPVVGIRLDKQSNIRDLVKTPDEVADLPVHEEADSYDYHTDYKNEQRGEIGSPPSDQIKDSEKDDKRVTEGERLPKSGEIKEYDHKATEILNGEKQSIVTDNQIPVSEVHDLNVEKVSKQQNDILKPISDQIESGHQGAEPGTKSDEIKAIAIQEHAISSIVDDQGKEKTELKLSKDEVVEGDDIPKEQITISVQDASHEMPSEKMNENRIGIENQQIVKDAQEDATTNEIERDAIASAKETPKGSPINSESKLEITDDAKEVVAEHAQAAKPDIQNVEDVKDIQAASDEHVKEDKAADLADKLKTDINSDLKGDLLNKEHDGKQIESDKHHIDDKKVEKRDNEAEEKLIFDKDLTNKDLPTKGVDDKEQIGKAIEKAESKSEKEENRLQEDIKHGSEASIPNELNKLENGDSSKQTEDMNNQQKHVEPVSQALDHKLFTDLQVTDEKASNASLKQQDKENELGHSTLKAPPESAISEETTEDRKMKIRDEKPIIDDVAVKEIDSEEVVVKDASLDIEKSEEDKDVEIKDTVQTAVEMDGARKGGDIKQEERIDITTIDTGAENEKVKDKNDKETYNKDKIQITSELDTFKKNGDIDQEKNIDGTLKNAKTRKDDEVEVKDNIQTTDEIGIVRKDEHVTAKDVKEDEIIKDKDDKQVDIKDKKHLTKEIDTLTMVEDSGQVKEIDVKTKEANLEKDKINDKDDDRVDIMDKKLIPEEINTVNKDGDAQQEKEIDITKRDAKVEDDKINDNDVKDKKQLTEEIYSSTKYEGVQQEHVIITTKESNIEKVEITDKGDKKVDVKNEEQIGEEIDTTTTKDDKKVDNKKQTIDELDTLKKNGGIEQEKNMDITTKEVSSETDKVKEKDGKEIEIMDKNQLTDKTDTAKKDEDIQEEKNIDITKDTNVEEEKVIGKDAKDTDANDKKQLTEGMDASKEHGDSRQEKHGGITIKDEITEKEKTTDKDIDVKDTKQITEEIDTNKKNLDIEQENHIDIRTKDANSDEKKIKHKDDKEVDISDNKQIREKIDGDTKEEKNIDVITKDANRKEEKIEEEYESEIDVKEKNQLTKEVEKHVDTTTKDANTEKESIQNEKEVKKEDKRVDDTKKEEQIRNQEEVEKNKKEGAESDKNRQQDKLKTDEVLTRISVSSGGDAESSVTQVSDNKEDHVRVEGTNLEISPEAVDKVIEETKMSEKETVLSVLKDVHKVAEVDKKLQELKSKINETDILQPQIVKEIETRSAIDATQEVGLSTSDKQYVTSIEDKEVFKPEVKGAIFVTSKVEQASHPETVTITSDSAPESPTAPSLYQSSDGVDKSELGSKSPKEREEDVAKIVASVAEVLKSDAPLEEFEGKVQIPKFSSFTPYTTELRETHITQIDSPTTEAKSQVISHTEKYSIDTFLDEERRVAPIHSDYQYCTDDKPTIKELVKESSEIIQVTSKIITVEDNTAKEEQKTDDVSSQDLDNATTVHRMLVTASSEDGGEETVICPPGSIIFSRSSESSGRSSPELTSGKKSSVSIEDTGECIINTQDSKITLDKEESVSERSTPEITVKDVEQSHKIFGSEENKPVLTEFSPIGKNHEIKDGTDSKSKELKHTVTTEAIKEETVIDTSFSTPDIETSKKRYISESATSMGKDEPTVHSTASDIDLRGSDVTELIKDAVQCEESETKEKKTREDAQQRTNTEITTATDVDQKSIDVSYDIALKMSESDKTLKDSKKSDIDLSGIPNVEKDLHVDDTIVLANDTGGKQERQPNTITQDINSALHYTIEKDHKQPTHKKENDVQFMKKIGEFTDTPEEILSKESTHIEKGNNESKGTVKLETTKDANIQDDFEDEIKQKDSNTHSRPVGEAKISVEDSLQKVFTKQEDENKTKSEHMEKEGEFQSAIESVSEEQTYLTETKSFNGDDKFTSQSLETKSEGIISIAKEIEALSMSATDKSLQRVSDEDATKKERKEDIADTIYGNTTEIEKASVDIVKQKDADTTTKDLGNKNNEKTQEISKIVDIVEKDSNAITTETKQVDIKEATQTTTHKNKTENEMIVSKQLTEMAGPSTISSFPEECSSLKLSTEDLHLSGKSTPDIAEVERLKEMQEILKHEKHIPGSSTPPTVPVSPVVKEKSSPLKDEVGTKNERSTTSDGESKEIKKLRDTSSVKGSDISTSSTMGSEYDYEQSDITSGQVFREHSLYESDKIDSEDDDIPGSPTSVTSQVAHSRSPSHYDLEEDSHQGALKVDPMSVSLYGALPEDITCDITMGDRYLDTADLDFDKAVQEHRKARGEDLEKYSSANYLYEVTNARFSAPETSTSVKHEGHQVSGGAVPHEGNLMTASFIGTELPSDQSKSDDPVGKWGKPLGLPSPAPPGDNKSTPKKERKLPPNVTAKNKLNDDKKRSDSPSKYDKRQKKSNCIYVDLTYVPHHGNSNYSFIDFFKRIRARYYVFSGIEPSKEVYNALLEAKQTWDDKDLGKLCVIKY